MIRSGTDKRGMSLSPGMEVITVSALFLLLLPCYYNLYLTMMPNSHQELGHDYRMFLPDLLAGYYWYVNNGLLSVPWFSPAQCGGIPYYPDPNAAYYSVPQFLAFVSSPLTAVQATFWIFASAGFWGCYYLTRICFRCSAPAASLAAALFLFNGFFVHRMLIGHLTFHPFMLAPVLAGALLPPPDVQRLPVATGILRIVIAALSLGYMFQAGMVNGIPPVVLACAVLFVMHAVLFRWRAFPWVGLCGAGVLSLLLCAGKLTATLALMRYFPRDELVLPGIGNLGTLVVLALRTLFLSVPDNASGALTNAPGTIDYFEWEYGISPIPALLLMAAAVTMIAGWIVRRDWQRPAPSRWAGWGLIILLLLIPIALNWYQPAWNGLLKSLPYFKNSSKLVRWFSAYIPVAIVASALALDRLRLPFANRLLGRMVLAGLGVAGMLVWFFNIDQSYYRNIDQFYKVATIEDAYAKAAATHIVPPITAIDALESRSGRIAKLTVIQNDFLTRGYSQLMCLQPIFGYGDEKFPVKSLKPGPVLATTNGVLNVKNPACYVFPKENKCEPGDQFAASDRADAEAFLQYKPYRFVEPAYATIANTTSVITLFVLLASMATAVAAMIRGMRWPGNPLTTTPARGAEAAKPSSEPRTGSASPADLPQKRPTPRPGPRKPSRKSR